jgi:prephenate dehydrogenase
MWADVFLENRENTLEAICQFRRVLEEIEGLIKAENIDGLKEELRKAVRAKNSMDR